MSEGTSVLGSGRPDVVVIGAGVMGLATARALAYAGRSVLVLEQDVVGTHRGSSHGSSRIFRLAYEEKEWVRLAEEALPLWRELERETGVELIAARGSLDVGGELELLAAVLSACDVAFDVLEAEEARRRFDIEIGTERALHQPDGGVVWAEEALRALSWSARSHGARLVEGRRAHSLHVGGDGVRVETSDGALDAPVAVVTAGPWAPPLLATAGVHLPVSVTLETVVLRTFPRAEKTLLRAETCLYTSTADDRFVLERHGRLVVGSPCSGHGFKFAPAIGARLAALAAEVLE